MDGAGSAILLSGTKALPANPYVSFMLSVIIFYIVCCRQIQHIHRYHSFSSNILYTSLHHVICWETFSFIQDLTSLTVLGTLASSRT